MPGSSINKETMISGIVNNLKKQVTHYTASPNYNYWNPLTIQVEELGSSHEQKSQHQSSQHKVVSTKPTLPPQPTSDSHVTSLQGDVTGEFDVGCGGNVYFV